jgi:hypothetical protein
LSTSNNEIKICISTEAQKKSINPKENYNLDKGQNLSVLVRLQPFQSFKIKELTEGWLGVRCKVS